MNRINCQYLTSVQDTPIYNTITEIQSKTVLAKLDKVPSGARIPPTSATATNRTIRYYSKYKWRASTGGSESSHFAHVRRHFST